jgi:acyl-CoA thioesterase
MSDAPYARALRDAAAVDPLGPGRYHVTLSPQYTVVGRPNGGYLQCVMASAALAEAATQGATHQHAIGVATNYCGAPEVGEAEVHVDVRRIGRGASFLHTTLVQAGVVTNESIVTLSTLREDATPRYHDAQPPLLPPLDACVSRGRPDAVDISTALDQRYDPATVRWTEGVAVDRAEIRSWLRLVNDATEWDAWSLLFASDALPPAPFAIGSSGWVPTLQLQSFVRAIPQGDWLRVRQWCVVIADGILDERCEIFDERDRLVASASQLALVRFPQESQ